MATVDLLHLGCGKGIVQSGGGQVPVDRTGSQPAISSTENLNHTLIFVNTFSIKSMSALNAPVGGLDRSLVGVDGRPLRFAILRGIGNSGRGGRLDGTNRDWG